MNPQTDKLTSILTPLKQVTLVSKYLSLCLFILLPFIGGFVGYSYTQEPAAAPVYCPAEAILPEKVTKKSYFGGEIPADWSTFSNGDAALADQWPVNSSPYVRYSLAQESVWFGDWNAYQVDFYFLTEKAAEEFIQTYQSTSAEVPSLEQTEEKVIGGKLAYVIHWPLDDGQSTKAAAGGSTYLVMYGDEVDAVKYLLINKQAKNEEDFEKSFQHFLDTVNFSDY